MRVVDTSAWIEWLSGSALGKRLTNEEPPRSVWIVPTLVQLELAKWLLRESEQAELDRVVAYTGKCVVAPLDTRTALLAAELHHRYGLATADAVFYATARERGADLLTFDAHFKDLPDVVYLAKTP